MTRVHSKNGLWNLWAWLGILVAVAGLFTPVASAQAQRPSVAQMHLSIWPEYDDARLLVLYRGELAAGTPLPQTVEFRIPAKAEVNAAANIAPGGQLIANPYTTGIVGDWQVVTYTLATPQFQLEFYAPLVQGSPDSRQVDYRFSTIYPIASLQAEVQQPLRSTGFVVTPEPLRTSTDDHGFQIAEYDFGSVPADASFDFKLSYSKTDTTPSVPRATMPAAEEITVPLPSESQPATDNTWTATALLVGALALTGAAMIGIALLIRSRRRAPVAAARPGARRTVSTAPGFCTECGARLEPGARFCSQCGTPVRGVQPGEKRR